MQVNWIYSNEQVQWEKKTLCEQPLKNPSIWLDGAKYQEMLGFGACFNELGFSALEILPENLQEDLLRDLFGNQNEQCNFNVCRLPIGANDYAKDWYSLNEKPGDYAMQNFSIERDRGCLIPYVQRALAYQNDMKLFSSPWSPPTWMKNRAVYNGGKLKMTEKNLLAYSLYFEKYVKAYAEEGICIDQVHIQNEPVANQNFPSCLWTGDELRIFIRDYIGPCFEREGLNTEIWLGTINAPGCDFNELIFDKWATEDYDYFANTVLSDDEALRYITGVSYQWGGKIAIQRTFESWWPRIRLMQSENECGFGNNTWENALYNWTMMKHYIGNGAESYLYWNFMLEPFGISTWGDPQNAMITIDKEKQQYIFNPDYYVMKHFSATIQRGAVRLGAKGPFAGDSLVFQNPDGSTVFVVFNPFNEKRNMTVMLHDEYYTFTLESRSINSIIFS